MKIAMFGQKGIPASFGGVETHAAELSTRLVRAGHAVFAYARFWYTPKSIATVNGVRVVRVLSLHTKCFDTITHVGFSLVHALLFVRPDVYHFHGVGPALLAWVPRLLAPRATVVVTFHSIDRLHQKWGLLGRWALSLGERAAVAFPHQTIAVSKTIAKYVKQTYSKTVAYVPNGITPRRVAMDSIVLAPFGLEPYRFVTMVSRLVPHKHAHTLITAWKKAKTLRPELFRNMKLAIVGGSAFTDDYVARLQLLAKSDSSIVFTSYQTGETLEALFAGSRFVVHPSVAEGLPIAVLEAMSYGKAVIAADIPENLEVMGEYGVSFARGKANDLAKKIIELIEDQTQAAALGHLARTYVEDAFNWDDIAKEVVQLYDVKRASLRLLPQLHTTSK